MADFSGQVVILTGASGGFGAAAARYFSEAGAHLVLSDLSSDRLERLVRELGSNAVAMSGDVADPETSKRLVEKAISEFGGLDIAINNAGIAHDLMPLPDIPVDAARKTIDVDLMGVFYAMRAQLPVMEKQYRENGQGGSIVNVASVAGVVAAPMLSVYAAAKHGVVGLTKSAAIEYARRGVRVNALCPSFARTPMATDFLDKAGDDRVAAEAALVQAIPMRRLAEVDEVINGLIYLADPASSFVTGQTLQIDGGLSAS